MTAVGHERVLSVRHWTDAQFSFTTTRDPGLRFTNGQFVMVGLHVGDRPLLRAYSIASANYEEHLEFLSIKVPDGPLTSRLQHVREGDEILVSRKPTGSLLLDDLRPGRNLYLLATVYQRFTRVIFVHGVRTAKECAVVHHQIAQLKAHELLGRDTRKLRYFPTVTRERHVNQGRLTGLIESGHLFDALGLPPLSPTQDRAMVCGGRSMLIDTRALLDARGFAISPNVGEPGDYVTERAFATH